MTTPTENPAAPEGAAQDSPEDLAAEQALVDAAREADDGTEDDDETFDRARALRKIEKANREAKGLREQIAALKPLAEEAEKRRKGEMSESARLTEEKAALEVRLAELTTANVRRDAAEAAGLPAKFHKFITAADPTEALDQAKELAKALKGPDEGKKPTNLGQGARGANNPGSTLNSDDVLRQMARRS